MTGERINIPALRMQLGDDPRAVPWWGVQSAVTRDDLAALLDVADAARAFEADLSDYCDGPERDALRAGLSRLEWGDAAPEEGSELTDIEIIRDTIHRGVWELRLEAFAALSRVEARQAAYEQALARIEHFPFDVNSDAASDLRTVKEIARAVLDAQRETGQ